MQPHRYWGGQHEKGPSRRNLFVVGMNVTKGTSGFLELGSYEGRVSRGPAGHYDSLRSDKKAEWKVERKVLH